MTTDMASLAAAPDLDLVQRAVAGDSAALETLLRRHQPWVFNLALYMLQVRADAEDATQEILLKVTTALASFRGASSFRTWLGRVATHHVLDRRRSAAERAVHGFDCYASYLEQATDAPLGAAGPQERHLLVQEARFACTLGMLLCLDRDQRVSFVLGEVLEMQDGAAADVLGIKRANFRQRLARARADLAQFLAGRCGLVDPANPCRCARKTQAFVRDGVVDPRRLQFAPFHVEDARQGAARSLRRLDVLQQQSSELGALYPAFEAPDLSARLRELITRPENAELLQ
jgi:RNA polymerase sigma factor (sigma-70 family)